jgi:TRAP-type C4-dicarboxylate transport system permease large subunit
MVTEQSIGKLFLAGLVPGVVLAALFAAVIIGWCRINPAIGPRSTTHTWKEKLSSLPEVVWPLVIFVLMIGGLMGAFTPLKRAA